MTSYEFEVVAKNAVIKVAKERYGVELEIQDLDFVWFAHELGYKKCTLFAPQLYYYPEVTYNRNKDELYVDFYSKSSHTVVPANDFKFTVN